MGQASTTEWVAEPEPDPTDAEPEPGPTDAEPEPGPTDAEPEPEPVQELNYRRHRTSR